eukprot:scaffold18793_cov130-Skeletonema_marinoi.AAC.2
MQCMQDNGGGAAVSTGRSTQTQRHRILQPKAEAQTLSSEQNSNKLRTIICAGKTNVNLVARLLGLDEASISTTHCKFWKLSCVYSDTRTSFSYRKVYTPTIAGVTISGVSCLSNSDFFSHAYSSSFSLHSYIIHNVFRKDVAVGDRCPGWKTGKCSKAGGFMYSFTFNCKDCGK